MKTDKILCTAFNACAAFSSFDFGVKTGMSAFALLQLDAYGPAAAMALATFAQYKLAKITFNQLIHSVEIRDNPKPLPAKRAVYLPLARTILPFVLFGAGAVGAGALITPESLERLQNYAAEKKAENAEKRAPALTAPEAP